MNNGKYRHKIRPFNWRDLLLIQRLQGQGQTLDYERLHVDGIFPLRDALQSYVLLGTGSQHTFVMSRHAFAQFICFKGSKRMRLNFLAPAPTRSEHFDRGIEMLEQLVAALGSQNIHHIVAEARHDGPEMDLLRQTGFGMFTRQVLFRLGPDRLPKGDLPPLPGLRRWQSSDDWGVRLLYANTVPQMAQQIEAPVDDALNPSLWSNRCVLENDGEILAYLAVRRGRVGYALRLLLHPEADVHVEALIRHGLARLSDAPPHDVYCRVRRYEGWLHAPLEASGFEPVFGTALLVKHTVNRVMSPEWNQVPVEDRIKMTRPIAHARLGKSSRLPES